MDALLAATRPARLAEALLGDPRSYAGHLGDVVPIYSPYDGWRADYNGRMDYFALGRNVTWKVDLSDYGFTDAYERGWEGVGAVNAGGAGAVAFDVYEFSSIEEALRFQEDAAKSACQDAQATYTFVDMPYAVGQAILAAYPYAQYEVSFVLGPRVYFPGFAFTDFTKYDDSAYVARVGRAVAR